MITKDKKSVIIKELESALKDTQSIVFVNFHKITVLQANNLRKALRAEGTGYRVAKKTLLKRVLDGKYEGTLPVLDGEIAIAYGQDPLAPARGVSEFEKSNKKSLQIVGGVFEGRFMSQEEMIAIANIPGLQVLRGMFVNVINSPIQGLVVVLNAIAEKQA